MYVRVHASTRLFVCVCIMAGCERAYTRVRVRVCVRVRARVRGGARV